MMNNNVLGFLKKPFVPAGRPREQLGMNRGLDDNRNAVARSIHNERQKKNLTCHAKMAMSSHRKYLRKLEEKKKMEKLRKMEDELLEEQKRRKFMDKQRKLRKRELHPTKKKKNKTKEKPKWAVTEDDLLTVDDSQEKEVEKLLDFTKDLDFEDYVDDLEVREALEIIKNRVEVIEEKKADPVTEEGKNIDNSGTKKEKIFVSGELNATNKPIKLKLAKHDKEWSTSTKISTSERRKREDENLIRNLKKKISTVHSQKSLAKLIDTIKDIDNPIEEMSKKEKLRRKERLVSGYIENAEQYAKPRVNVASRQRHLVDMKKNRNSTKNIGYLYKCPQI